MVFKINLQFFLDRIKNFSTFFLFSEQYFRIRAGRLDLSDEKGSSTPSQNRSLLYTLSQHRFRAVTDRIVRHINYAQGTYDICTDDLRPHRRRGSLIID